MSYFSDYHTLKLQFEHLSGGADRSVLVNETTELIRLPFTSRYLLPQEGEAGDSPFAPSAASPSLRAIATSRDTAITENRRFDYYLVRSRGGESKRRAILLFHGLNERSWDKYLPWALELHRRTQSTVVLFPIAFHMNRAPREWSSPRRMAALADERRRLFPEGREISFANAALSTRLQTDPRRFLYSGFQTYGDAVSLVRSIRNGSHPLFARGAAVDLFGYSIGAFLIEFLMLGNPEGLFGDSRAFLFCGGAALDGMNPVSRYIMDSEAGATMSGYFTRELAEDAERRSPVQWVFSRLQSLGLLFRSLVSTETYRQLRQSYLAAVRGRLRAVALERDSVIPQPAVSQLLDSTGAHNDSSTVRLLDFPYPYSHVQPFPLLDHSRTEVERAFDLVFTEAAGAFTR